MQNAEKPRQSTIVAAIVFVVLAVIVSGTVINMDRECINQNGRLVDNGRTYTCELAQ